MIDVCAAVADHLRTVPLFEGFVWADRIPEGASLPFVCVRSRAQDLMDGCWWLVEIVIDVVGDDGGEAECAEWAQTVAVSLRTYRNMILGNVVVQNVDSVSMVFDYDMAFTPMLPRWVLTCELLVREK